MNFKHEDLSFFAGDVEVLTFPGEYLDTIEFPDTYENIESISISFGDRYVTNSEVIINVTLISIDTPVEFSIDGSSFDYSRLFDFIDETDGECITNAFFVNFQLECTYIFQKWAGNFVRQNPKKPVVRCYENGKINQLQFMLIDNCNSYIEYTDCFQWNKPDTIFFDQTGNFKDETYITFSDVNKTTAFQSFKIKDYANLLYKFTGHNLKWNHEKYEFEFQGYTFSNGDVLILDMYIYFEQYKKMLETIFLDKVFTCKEDVLNINNREKLLLQMIEF